MTSIKKVMALCLTLMLMCSCGPGEGVTKEEYLTTLGKTSLGGNSIADIKGSMQEWVLTIYNPQSQEAIDKSYDKIAKYCTAEFIANMKLSVNPYKEGQRQSVEIKDCVIGNKEQSTDNTTKLLMTFDVKSSTLTGMSVSIEFMFNGDGKIYKHDIWAVAIKAD